MSSKINTTFDNLTNKITSGIISPVYLLFGEEEFLIKKTLKTFIELIIPKEEQDFNVEYIDATVISQEQIVDTANTYPFLPGKKLLIIQNYPLFSDANQAMISNAIEQSIKLFEKGEHSASACKIVNSLDIDVNDLSDISKNEFIKIVQDKTENTFSDDDLNTLENIYIYLNENTEEVAAKSTDFNTSDLLANHIKTKQTDFSIFLFVSFGNINKKNNLYKTIMAKGEIIEFSVEKDNIESYLDELKKELLKEGIKISPGALFKLKEKTGIHLGQIYKEIEKIKNFLGNKKTIEENDIDILVTRSETEKIYELTDALSEKKLDKAIQVLNRLLQDQAFPLQILAGIITRFRLLLQCKLLVKEGILPDKNIFYPHFMQKIYPSLKEKNNLLPSDKAHNLLKQHPYVVFKIIQQSSKFSLDELKKNYLKIQNADLELKLSSHSPKMILEFLIFSLFEI